MDARKILLGGALAGALLWGAKCDPILTDTGPIATLEDSPAPVGEDSPAWDCRTMGNRQCGPFAAEEAPDGFLTVSDRDGVRAVMGPRMWHRTDNVGLRDELLDRPDCFPGAQVVRATVAPEGFAAWGWDCLVALGAP